MRTFTAGLFWHPGKKQDEEEADECLHAVIRLIEIGSLWVVAFRTVLAHPSLPRCVGGRSGNR